MCRVTILGRILVTIALLCMWLVVFAAGTVCLVGCTAFLCFSRGLKLCNAAMRYTIDSVKALWPCGEGEGHAVN